MILGINTTQTSPPFTPTTFTQCQAMPTTFAMNFMDSGNTQNTDNIDEFITLDNSAGTVTIDTTDAVLLGFNSGNGMTVYPSYRTVETVTCNGVYTSLCTTLTMPIMLHNAA